MFFYDFVLYHAPQLHISGKQVNQLSRTYDFKEFPLRNVAIAFACALSLAAPAAYISYAEAAPAGNVSRIAVVVNGDMITVRELDKAAAPELENRKLDPTKAGDAAQIDAIKRQVLDSMISEKILMQEADKLGIKVSDEMVAEELNRFIAESQLAPEEFMRQMTKQGMTQETMNDRMRRNIVSQMLIGRMVVSKVVVTDKEIADYYRQHMTDMPSGQVRVALVVYPAGEDAAAWAARIASGKTRFEDVARQVSVGPNPEGGGDLGFMAVEELAPILRQEVENLKEGQVSKLFDLQVNKAQMRLVEVTSPEVAPDVAKEMANAMPDAATATRIEEMLRQPRLEARFKEYTDQLRAKALVDIRY